MTYAQKQARKKARVARLVEVLKEHGISLTVHACTCCDSPVVTFRYLGETILDNELLCNFSTEPEEQE